MHWEIKVRYFTCNSFSDQDIYVYLWNVHFLLLIFRFSDVLFKCWLLLPHHWNNLNKIIFILHTNKDLTNLNLSTHVSLLKASFLTNLPTFASPESLQWTYFPVSSVCKLAKNYSSPMMADKHDTTYLIRCTMDIPLDSVPSLRQNWTLLILTQRVCD